ncbi:MAG: hypothetical protein P4N59_27820 [Negativicutes bacterium]|nr:hypothetical protein [Negativicutes bacterium]
MHKYKVAFIVVWLVFGAAVLWADSAPQSFLAEIFRSYDHFVGPALIVTLVILYFLGRRRRGPK